MKRNIVRAFVLSLIVVMTYTDSFADIRVRFARGRTSATMTGSLGRKLVVCYVATAREGQTLNATVSSRNGKVKFLDMNDTSYTEYLKFSGDHRVCLSNGGSMSAYTLTVSIR